MSKELVWPSLDFETRPISTPKIDVPFSDLSYQVKEGDIFHEMIEAFPLTRLQQVKQLSFLIFANTDTGIVIPAEFLGGRFWHTLHVPLIQSRILSRNGFSQDEIEREMIKGGLHDIATPAFGDAAKKVDPASLDEETHWKDVIGEKGYALLEKYNLDTDSISRSLLNEDLSGEVLDIADRIAYVMRDASTVYNPKSFISGKYIPSLDDGLEEFGTLLFDNPDIGNIYKDVVVDKDSQQVYFADPNRLREFLKLRAMLNKFIYRNPYSLGRDVFIGRFIKKLLENGELGPQQLRTMRDVDLLSMLHSSLHPDSPDRKEAYYRLVQWIPNYIAFANEDDLNREVERLEENPDIFIIGTAESKGFDTATSYLVKNGDNVIPFSECDPQGAARIESINDSLKGHYLFYSFVSRESKEIKPFFFRDLGFFPRG